jgi:hypothetical protein
MRLSENRSGLPERLLLGSAIALLTLLGAAGEGVDHDTICDSRPTPRSTGHRDS